MHNTVYFFGGGAWFCCSMPSVQSLTSNFASSLDFLNFCSCMNRYRWLPCDALHQSWRPSFCIIWPLNLCRHLPHLHKWIRIWSKRPSVPKCRSSYFLVQQLMNGPSLLQALLWAEVSTWQRQIQTTWTLEPRSKFTIWIFALLRIQAQEKEPNVNSHHIFLDKGQISPSSAKI